MIAQIQPSWSKARRHEIIHKLAADRFLRSTNCHKKCVITTYIYIAKFATKWTKIAKMYQKWPKNPKLVQNFWILWKISKMYEIFSKLPQFLKKLPRAPRINSLHEKPKIQKNHNPARIHDIWKKNCTMYHKQIEPEAPSSSSSTRPVQRFHYTGGAISLPW